MKESPTIAQDNVEIDERFLIRTIAVSLFITILVSLYAACVNWRWALEYVVISLLTILNFSLLYLICKQILSQQLGHLLLLLVLMKFVLVVGMGAFFLVTFGFIFSAFLAGFNTLFLVIVLRVLGLWIFSTGKQRAAQE